MNFESSVEALKVREATPLSLEEEGVECFYSKQSRKDPSSLKR